MKDIMSNSIEVLVIFENLPFYIKGVYQTTIDASFCCNFIAKATSNRGNLIYKLPALQAIYASTTASSTPPPPTSTQNPARTNRAG